MIALKPAFMNIVMTGRGAHDDLIKLADLVIEMKKLKHPFNNGVQPRTGIRK